MVNNNPYSAFNISALQPKTTQPTQQKKAEENNSTKPKNQKQDKFILALPPTIGALGGVLSSIVYSNNKNKKIATDIESYKQGLELGYNTSSLYLQLQEEIKKSKEFIAKTQKENQDILEGIEVVKKNARQRKEDYSSLIKNDEDLIKLNNELISNKKSYIEQFEKTLQEFYQKAVVKHLEEFTSKATSLVKSQKTKFTIASIAIATLVGAAISFVINRSKNIKEKKTNENITNQK